MRYYFAPMEGLTDSVYRKLHHQYFSGVDAYYMPFISPTVHRCLTHREARELPVADSVRMALENLKDADPEILKGIELISNQLDKSFEKLKVEAYGKVGEDFDPNLHNAIGMVDNEELGSGKLAAVFQTGYKIGDKIIRHAMVQVTN